jgi:hypothetical protein
LKLPLRPIPLVVLVHHQEFLVIGIQQPLYLAVVAAVTFLLEFAFDLLPLISSDVNRVAALAAAVLAPVGRESGSTLKPRDLAKAAFARFREGLHAVTAAAILHDELSTCEVSLIAEEIIIMTGLVVREGGSVQNLSCVGRLIMLLFAFLMALFLVERSILSLFQKRPVGPFFFLRRRYVPTISCNSLTPFYR